jgi:hypothetical protein
MSWESLYKRHTDHGFSIVLVEFEPNQPIGLMAVARMERELPELVGRQVDLRTPQDLSRYFRDKVVSEAEVLYDKSFSVSIVDVMS